MTVGTPLQSCGTLTNAKAGVQIGKLERERVKFSALLIFSSGHENNQGPAI